MESTEVIENKHDLIQSVTSYGIGCTSIAMGWICNVTDLMQAMAIMFGCIVVFIRLVHDAVSLVRFIRDGK